MSGLHEAFDDIVADVPVYGDLDRAVEQADRERRRRYGAVAGLAAAAVVVAVVVGVVATSRDANTSPEPVSPVTTPTTTPSAEYSSTPLRPWADDQWEGALREDQASLPVIPLAEGRLDARDARVAGVDIRRVSATSRPEWRLELEAAPPLASTLDPIQRIMEQGVVVDSDGDRLADCHIAISTDAPRPGDVRVWVTDLETDVTTEQVGPPYGYPIDFFHPASRGDSDGADTAARTVALFFLSGEGASCAPFGRSAAFYTYAVVLEGGRPTDTDFAPDAAWLEMP